MAFHQQATDELGGNQLGGAAEEGLGEGWEGIYGYGSCLDARAFIDWGIAVVLAWARPKRVAVDFQPPS